MAEEANNMDLDMETLDKLNDLDLEGLKDTIDGAGARERLLQMIEDGELSEDARESLRAMLAENTPLFAGYGVLVALGFATLTFSVIFFFGYKLYKSIRDKEKKKEEKKKAKQQKKKK